MRLLHTQYQNDGSLDITLTECAANSVNYAILSHRWARPEDEVSYYDLVMKPDSARKKPGYNKIYNCCRISLERDNLEYVWIDTCCIDKSSSAELSEAINSMFEWYRNANICHVYLDGVPSHLDAKEGGSFFRKSEWFTRGWTLQELLAPNRLDFLSKNWERIGTRDELADLISDITRIETEVLKRSDDLVSLERFSVATRLSWAADRKTTRVEDRAYSLLGLFGINIPTVYGEGERAFVRLQQEIMRTSSDQTIFAWQSNILSSGMMAASPDQFSKSSAFIPSDYGEYMDFFNIKNPKPDYSMTNYGIHIQLPIRPIPRTKGIYLAALAIENYSSAAGSIIFLRRYADTDNALERYIRISVDERSIDDYRARDWRNWQVRTIWISGPGDSGHPKQLRTGRQRENSTYYYPPVRFMFTNFSRRLRFIDVHPRDAWDITFPSPSLSLPVGSWGTAIFADEETKFVGGFGTLDNHAWFSWSVIRREVLAKEAHRRFNIIGGRYWQAKPIAFESGVALYAGAQSFNGGAEYKMWFENIQIRDEWEKMSFSREINVSTEVGEVGLLGHFPEMIIKGIGSFFT